jgi:pimeloyl-ACP methyl ester carboxylesterase
MPSTSTSVGEVSYQIHGTGPPIILLHAILHSCHDFDAIVPKLSLRYQTIAVDGPWHGDSSHSTTQQPTAALFADVLEEIVASLNLPPAIFIGNSVGGFAAARLSIRHPKYVKGLVLVNTGGFVDWDWTLRLFARPLGIPLVERWILPSMVWKYMLPQNSDDKKIAMQVAALAKTDEGSKIAAGVWKSFLDPSYDLRSEASKIKAPTLIIWGKKDPIVPLKVGQATHRAIEGSVFEVLDTGHAVFASKPDEFLRLVEPFIEQCFSDANAGAKN